MSLDDLSLLSGYLDGELDSATRSRVEVELLASSCLAEELQGAAMARTLVSGLARPALEVDLSQGVMGVVAERDRLHHLRVRVASLAAAAVLMLACIPLFSDWPGNPRPVAGVGPRPGRAGTINGPPRVAVADAADSGDGSVETVSGGVEARPSINADSLADLERLRSILATERGEPSGRIWLAAGGDGVAAELGRVRELVATLHRREPAWAEVDLSGDQVLDADTPGAATVFALRLDPGERDELREALRRGMPGLVVRVEERTGSAPMLAGLLERGPLRVGAGLSVTPVISPPNAERLAMKGGNLRSEESAGEKEEPEPSPMPELAAVRPYLLWVTTAPSYVR
jgi:hypothetical protein